MKQRTSHVTVNASPERTFEFLAAVENLPRWAIHFCHQLVTENGRHRVRTPQGEIDFWIDADAATGVIDFVGGPDSEHLARFPARVVSLPGEQSMVLFTNIQYPGVDDAQFEAMCGSLAEELELVRRHVEASGAGV